MSILVTGGRGKTAGPLCGLLHQANIPFVVASRSRDDSLPYQQAHFDWSDEKTYTSVLQSREIKAAYLVPPPTDDLDVRMKAFIDVARTHGVKRFVLLSGSPVEAGAPGHGQVHQYLMELEVEWAVLRPTWFQENFKDQLVRLDQSKSLKIYSATGEGKTPFVSCDDIAAVAFRALVDETPHNTDHLIMGPEMLTYGDVAQILSEVTGRKFEHVNLTQAEMTERFIQGGIPEAIAGVLGVLDNMIANGGIDKLNDVVEKITGRPPKKFRTFVEQNRARFM